ncbi:hypothetical protein, partial [Campylobacter jejuni]|uniref:hypothetical protein n=1 Tax=Campylobacter jejuni TaxID=197 RepID=UPI001E4488F7
MELANVIGVFYVLSIGSTLAMFLAFIAVVLETWRVCRENKVRSFECKRLNEIPMIQDTLNTILPT